MLRKIALGLAIVIMTGCGVNKSIGLPDSNVPSTKMNLQRYDLNYIVLVPPHISRDKFKIWASNNGFKLIYFTSLGSGCPGSLARIIGNNPPNPNDFEDEGMQVNPELVYVVDRNKLENPPRIHNKVPIPKIRFPQFYNSSMNAAKVINHPYDKNISGKEATIAVLDTGISKQEGDEFGHRLLPGRQFTERSQRNTRLSYLTIDDFVMKRVQGHGTQVANLAAGQAFGIAKGASILPVKVCDEKGKCRTGDVIEGVCWAMTQKKEEKIKGKLIINLSLGGSENTSNQSILKDIIFYGVKKNNTLFVQSVGNQWDDYLASGLPRSYEPVQYPAAFNISGLVAVGAVERFKESGKYKTSKYSNRGKYVDVLAPGTNVKSIDANGRTTLNTGTSFAAPVTAGAAALIWQKYPRASAIEMEHLLKRHTDSSRMIPPPQREEKDPYQLMKLLDLTNLNN